MNAIDSQYDLEPAIEDYPDNWVSLDEVELDTEDNGANVALEKVTDRMTIIGTAFQAGLSSVALQEIALRYGLVGAPSASDEDPGQTKPHDGGKEMREYSDISTRVHGGDLPNDQVSRNIDRSLRKMNRVLNS